MSESHNTLNGDGTGPKDEEYADKQLGRSEKVGLRERIDHFTWAWFTCTQSTGGIAITLSETPHQFAGLQTIGVVIFIFNLVLFLAFVALMSTRFILNPRKLRASLTTGPECLFFGSFWLTFATIIICMQRFGVPHAGPWLVVAIRVLFWIYAAVTFISTTVHLAVIYVHTKLDPHHMNPAWFLLIFNAMLTGTIAAAIGMGQPPAQRLPILVAGVAYQGLGWIVCTIFLADFVLTLMRNGLPEPAQRPGLFMPVGSAGYTIVALIGCARAAPRGYAYFAKYPIAADVVQIMATWVGVFMWMFTFWLFASALVCNIPTIFHWPKAAKGEKGWVAGRVPGMGFKMSWWALIFPNVGWTLATTFIGQELDSQGILWIATVQTILLVFFWLLDLGLMLKAVILGDVLWPGKDEDKDE